MQGTLVNLCYTMENHAIATMMTYFGSTDHGLGTEVDRGGHELQKKARFATDIYIYIYMRVCICVCVVIRLSPQEIDLGIRGQIFNDSAFRIALIILWKVGSQRIDLPQSVNCGTDWAH